MIMCIRVCGKNLCVSIVLDNKYSRQQQLKPRRDEFVWNVTEGQKFRMRDLYE